MSRVLELMFSVGVECRVYLKAKDCISKKQGREYQRVVSHGGVYQMGSFKGFKTIKCYPVGAAVCDVQKWLTTGPV